jgi:hypothetical protein
MNDGSWKDADGLKAGLKAILGTEPKSVPFMDIQTALKEGPRKAIEVMALFAKHLPDKTDEIKIGEKYAKQAVIDLIADYKEQIDHTTDDNLKNQEAFYKATIFGSISATEKNFIQILDNALELGGEANDDRISTSLKDGLSRNAEEFNKFKEKPEKESQVEKDEVPPPPPPLELEAAPQEKGFREIVNDFFEQAGNTIKEAASAVGNWIDNNITKPVLYPQRFKSCDLSG